MIAQNGAPAESWVRVGKNLLSRGATADSHDILPPGVYDVEILYRMSADLDSHPTLISSSVCLCPIRRLKKSPIRFIHPYFRRKSS